MATLGANYNIEINRGNVLILNIKATNKISETPYKFQPGDIIRFNLMEKGNHDNVIIQKNVQVTKECDTVPLTIPADEMKIGDIIEKPVDYYYEVELNPDTPMTMTILGYTKKTGPRILSLTPEGGDKK